VQVTTVESRILSARGGAAFWCCAPIDECSETVMAHVVSHWSLAGEASTAFCSTWGAVCASFGRLPPDERRERGRCRNRSPRNSGPDQAEHTVSGRGVVSRVVRIRPHLHRSRRLTMGLRPAADRGQGSLQGCPLGMVFP
jgi:hypothetical protein